MSGTDERQALAEAGEEKGWRRRESDRVDVYLRDRYRVRVIWQGTDAISGASFFDNECTRATPAIWPKSVPG